VFKCSVHGASYVEDLMADSARITYTKIDNGLDRVKPLCGKCFNNCGNHFYSNGYFDLLRSDFVQSRKNVYLATSIFDFFTPVAMKKAGVDFRRYRGQELGKNDVLFYVGN